MKKAIVAALLLLLCVSVADACVGKTLNIGVVDSQEGQVLAEMLSAIISERTGTTANIRYYKSQQEIYQAVKAKQVDISVENTARALQLLNRPAEPDVKKAYEVVKSSYEKDKGMVWLRPFGFLHGSGSEASSYTAAILRIDILNNFPVLPRVINKLGSAIDDESYSKLLKSVGSGEKAKTVARNFLRSKKLI